MKIQTAVYTYNLFNFLGYEATETDRLILTRMIEKATGEIPSSNGFYGNGLSFGNHGQFYADLDLAVLKKYIPISMRVYAERLNAKKPIYISARLFHPSKRLLESIIGCFDFPPILFDSEEKLEEFQKTFPGSLAVFRPNAEEIHEKGRILLKGGVPELGDYF